MLLKIFQIFALVSIAFAERVKRGGPYEVNKTLEVNTTISTITEVSLPNEYDTTLPPNIQNVTETVKVTTNVTTEAVVTKKTVGTTEEDSRTVIPSKKCTPVKFDRTVYFDEKKTVIFSWKDDFDNLTMSITAPALGWIGLGFSSDGTRITSDPVMVWNSENGPQVLDMRVNKEHLPEPDDVQNVEGVNFCQDDEKITAIITRKFDTCDSNDRVISEGTHPVIFAFSDNKIAADIPEKKDLHGMNMSGQELAPYFYIKNGEKEVPTSESYYHCQFVKFPTFDSQQQITQYTAEISEKSSPYVQRMVLYKCAGRLMSSNTNTGFDCMARTRPLDAKGCKSVVIEWMGGYKTYTFPNQAGYSLHGGAMYGLLEIKFVNPELQTGIMDDSGFKIWHSDHLRSNNTAVMKVNIVPHITNAIPPGSSSFTSQAHCMDQCIQTAFNQSLNVPEIKIYAVSLYAQNYARKLRLRHYRNGTELKPIVFDDLFDVNNNEKRVLKEEVTVRYDDYIVMECVYNTKNVTGMTYGGYGKEEETCEAFISYYPDIDLPICSSTPSEKYLFAEFKKSSTLSEIEAEASKMEWTDEARERLNKQQLASQIYIQCESQRGSYIRKHSEVTHPSLNNTYEAPSTCGSFSALNVANLWKMLIPIIIAKIFI